MQFYGVANLLILVGLLDGYSMAVDLAGCEHSHGAALLSVWHVQLTLSSLIL